MIKGIMKKHNVLPVEQLFEMEQGVKLVACTMTGPFRTPKRGAFRWN
jgi:peroxiredoxin family protein